MIAMSTQKDTNQAQGETIAGIKFYSIVEVAEILSVSVNTVRNYIKSNRLKSRKIRGKHMILLEDIQKFVLRPQN